MGKFNSSKEYHLRNRMYQYVKNNPNLPKKVVVKHFMEENVPKSTAHSILQRLENNLPPERRSRMTPARCKMTEDKVKLLKEMIDHSDGVS